MRELEAFCCQDSSCADYGRRDAENLRCWSGKKKQIRMLYCRTCKHYFSERKGSALWQSRLSEDRAVSVLEHLAEGCGVRETARLVKVHRNTVCRLNRQAGDHAARTHNEAVSLSPLTEEIQFDEKWSFVYQKEKRCDPECLEDERRGENWDHVALDPEHRLVLEVVPGKRHQRQTRTLIRAAQRRTGGRMMRLLTSDEYRAYRTEILSAYGIDEAVVRTGKPGRPRKPKTIPSPDLLYATVHKTRRNGRVVHVEPRLQFGTQEKWEEALARSPVSQMVNTSFVERFNGTDRHRNSRKNRKTYRFSKGWDQHNASTYFTTYSYNFCCRYAPYGNHSTAENSSAKRQRWQLDWLIRYGP